MYRRSPAARRVTTEPVSEILTVDAAPVNGDGEGGGTRPPVGTDVPVPVPNPPGAGTAEVEVYGGAVILIPGTIGVAVGVSRTAELAVEADSAVAEDS